MTREIWQDIPNYEGLYQASNTGKIRSMHYRGSNTVKMLCPRKERHGYLTVYLCKNGEKNVKKIHHLVAATFIPNPNEYKEINHKDGNPTNNNVDNIEWCDHHYNLCYGDRLKKVSEARGIKIKQCDLQGNTIQTWRSVRYAAKCLGLSNQNIIAALKGRQKTCGGYKWKYIKNNTNNEISQS